MMRFGSRTFDLSSNIPFVIAEIGVNHNGQLELAHRLVLEAVACGADIVKFQLFRAEEEISQHAPLAPYQEASSEAVNQLDLVKALELSTEAMAALKAQCDALNVGFLCSVFEHTSLASLDMILREKSVKFGSGEITNRPLLVEAARRGFDILLSTGASTLAEVEEAYQTLRDARVRNLVLFHCVSSYPAPVEQQNLAAISVLKKRFDVVIGYSDHSQGVECALIALGLGATVFEKHFTLDRSMPGPDHSASADPAQFRDYVAKLKAGAVMLGSGVKTPMPCELPNIQLIRKGAVAKRTIESGETLGEEDILFKRPAFGIDPREISCFLGKKVRRKITIDSPISSDDVE